MATPFFGQFLLEKSLITPEGLHQALQFQQKQRVRMDAIALENGWMDQKGVEAVTAEIHRAGGRFGEIAVRLGLLTEEQLFELLRNQKEKSIPIGQALVAVGALTVDVVERELPVFLNLQAEARARVAESKRNVAWVNATVASSLVQNLANQLLQGSNLPTKEVEPYAQAGAASLEGVCAYVRIEGDWAGHLVLQTTPELARSGASASASDLVEDERHSSFWLRDLLYSAADLACAELRADSIHVTAQEPRALEAGAPPLAGRETAVFPLRSVDGTLNLHIAPDKLS